MSIDNAYNVGYNVGFSWKYGYTPGGPFVIKRDSESERYNAEWMRGFADGLASQTVAAKRV